MPRCKACRQQYERTRPLQVVCLSADCAALYAAQVRARKAKRQQVEDMRATRAKLKALKPRSKLLAEAQAAVNRYVRLRDAGLPCIACQRPITGQAHASHYRSTAAAPELRFDLDNIHSGCAQCNTYLSGNLINYRAGLLERIGPERLAALEGPHPPRKWTREELIELRARFVKMAKELDE